MTRRLVLIEWHDGRRPMDTWSFIDDMTGFSPVVCQSVGWLIHDADDVKVLSPNIGDLKSEREQSMGAIQIPARCVISITNLRTE